MADRASLLTTIGSCSSACVMTLEFLLIRVGEGALPGVELVVELPPHETARTSSAATQRRVVISGFLGGMARGDTRDVLLRGGEQHEHRSPVRVDAEPGLRVGGVQVADLDQTPRIDGTEHARLLERPVILRDL